jgi:hypothetical protein
MLAEAAEMEHNLLCSYLYAAFSLRTAADGLSDEEARCVRSWRTAIMDVAVQEMGHLAAVNNIAVALGGEPHFDRPNFPVPPGYHPAQFELRLTSFSEETLDHFIFLERPEDAAVEEPPEFQSDGEPPREPRRPMVTPSARDYPTIGRLYHELRRELKVLAAERGAYAFYAADRQLAGADSGLEGLTVIRDLAGALATLRTVVEQGEGGPRGERDCHFARFSAIREEWGRIRERHPAFRPAHPSATDPVMRRPAAGVARVWITARPAAELLDLGNAIYGALLTLLAQLYEPHAPGGRKVLMGAAVKLMHGLSRVGEQLARLPASPEHPGTAGLTFAVPRAFGPRAETALIAERLSALAKIYADTVDGDQNPVEHAARSLE